MYGVIYVIKNKVNNKYYVGQTMNERDYSAELYEKMRAEQEQYRNYLLGQRPEEILNHTWEYTMREDMVMAMETLDLTPAQAKALLKSPHPLNDILEDFRKREIDHMDTIRDSIESRAKELLKRERKTRECR